MLHPQDETSVAPHHCLQWFLCYIPWK